MKYIQPVVTEKSTRHSKEGKYTFVVEKNLSKNDIKKLISETFLVHVKTINTISQRGEKKRTVRGRIKVIKPTKKVVVSLNEGESIDIFEEKKKKKGKKK